MKSLRICAIVMVLGIALAAGGCGKEYAYDFAAEMDLGEGSEAWVKVPPGASFAFNMFYGIRLDDGINPASIRTPIYFTGDFKVTVDFHLELDSSHIGDLAFMLTDDTWPADFNHAFYMPIFSICSSKEELHVADWRKTPYAYSELKDDGLPLVTLDTSGDNQLVLTKKDNQITVVFNNSASDTYGPYTLTNYTADKFYLTFSGDPEFSPGGGYGIYITRVKVKY